jgi:Right handed beta helix region/Periplasmic copper-binding protein (NosD)
MSRNRRFPRLLLLAALVCASLASAAAPATLAAADHIYRVDSARDDGGGTQAACEDNIATNKSCTLRQALTQAASDGGSSEIRFIIPPQTTDPDWGYNAVTKTWTISPTTALPTISADNTTIVGKGFFAPSIVIDGSRVAGVSAIGLKITSSNNTISKLAVVNFKDTGGTNGVGILISGANAKDNLIVETYIGVAPSGNVAQPNSSAGIKIDAGASNNTIGGAGEFNVISGNGTGVLSGTGILLSNTISNTIQGNFIGLGLAAGSTVPLGNTGDGIRVSDSDGNTIGGEGDARNIISANGQAGVLLTSGSAGNTIVGNFIGTDESGLADFGNGGDGVQLVNGATNNTIAGDDLDHSVIAGNGGYGVSISDSGTSGNKVLGAFIGVTDDGLGALPNTRGGVRIQSDAANNVVGGAGQGNVIAGNGGYGVALGGADGFTQIFSNTIAANYIGLSFDATQAVANSAGGVLLGSGSNSNMIGGSSAALQNIISGNGGPGVVVSGTATLDNTIAGNVIGLRRAGNGKLIVPAPNAGDGALIGGGAQGTRVGGASAAGNVIASNIGNGVHISGAFTTTIQSNLIGTAQDGATLLGLGNAQNGVLVENAAHTVVITGSTIYSNTLNGVLVTGGSQQVKITSNSISRNRLKGIELDPETSGAPGDAANPNHDIDPPFNVGLTQNGVLTGQVLVGASAAACNSCTIQIFTSDPVLLDGQGKTQITTTVTLSANGYFTATLGSVPAQVLLTATDGAGNTSEYALIERTFKVAIGPGRPRQEAIPGQIVTFTHYVTNTGTIGLTDLQITGTSKLNWPFTLAPTTPFTLTANTSRLVTLTLTLPTGSDPRVYAGNLEETRVTVRSTAMPTVTASITDETLVKPQFLLAVLPPTSLSALAKANDTVAFMHALKNNGNISTTIALTASTNLTWATSIAPRSYLLKPGETITATALVTVPQTVFANAIAKTTIRITSNDVTQNKILTDTTTITTTARATLTPNNETDGAAGETVSLLHVATNTSNGPATFKLIASSGLGSTISFRSNTAGIAIGPDNTFTLSTTLGLNRLIFFADVTINPQALPGSHDLITINLSDKNGVILASVQDTIRVTQAQIRPRLWLPVVRNE